MRAKIRRSLPGYPRNLPSAALLLRGQRIRCVDYEQWHSNPDGKRIKGWHEHIWSNALGAANVIVARPKLLRTATLLDVFQWGLEKWNIEVLENSENREGCPA